MPTRPAILAVLAAAAATASSAARGEERVGLAPDAAALTQAEAETATARGSSALFYNPAGLARPVWGVGIAEYYQTLDQETIDASRHLQRAAEAGEDVDLNEVYGYLDSGRAFAFEVGAVLLRVQLPHVAAQGFGYARATVRRDEGDDGGEPFYDFESVAHAGAAAGVALSYGKLSLGWSRYYLVRTRIVATPTVARTGEIVAGLESGELAPEDVPHQEFTRLELGNGLGNNFGMLYRPWDDNPTGLGLSALNAGGTKFRREPLVKGERAEAIDRRIDAFAERYDLTIENPDELRPLYNAGLCVGYGGGTDDVLTALAAVDVHDIGGHVIEHKLAGSGEVGVMLPREIANVASYVYKPKGAKSGYRIGILGARVLAGVRESEYSSYGFGFVFHAGTDKVSPLKLTIQNYVQESMAGAHRRQGYAVDLGLTLVY